MSYLEPPRELDYTDFMAHIYPELFNKKALDENSEKEIEASLAKTVTFQVTDDCCMACTYCYQHNKKHNVMDFETAKKFVDRILDLENPDPYINVDNSPAVIFDFIGGEPFMAIDLINDITNYITQRMIELDHPWLFRHRLSICSNGLLYFDPKVQDYLTRNLNRLSFSISIDGNKELHDACRVDLDGAGTYDRAIAAVKHFREHFHGHMGSKMTLAPENIAFTAAATIGLIESGYNIIHLNCVYEEGWTYNHATVLYAQLKELANYMIDHDYHKTHYISMFEHSWYRPKDETDNDNWCGGVDSLMISVDYKGDIFPCLRYMESSLNDAQKPVIIGNVDHGIYQTEEELKWKEELSGVTRRIQSTDECFNCPIAEGCAWCSAYNYEKFGTVRKRATFICPMHKATALANAYYWNLVYIKEHDARRFKIWLPEEKALEIISKEEWDTLKTLETFPYIEV